jgi:hypothetical protein
MSLSPVNKVLAPIGIGILNSQIHNPRSHKPILENSRTHLNYSEPNTQPRKSLNSDREEMDWNSRK